MKTKQIFRTLCLVAVMCMVSANALAYDVHHGGIIDVIPGFESCKILVVEEDATVDNCNVLGGGVLIIKEGKTVTVTTNFNCSNSTIYVYGTLNIEQTINHSIFNSTVYIMQGGSLVGFYNGSSNTISTNVAPAAAGSIEKVDAQVPTPANSFVGWPDYYQQRIYSTDGEDFYPLGVFENAACTQPITDLNAWKTKYANIFHKGYDAAYDAAYDAGYDAGQLKGDNIGYARGKEEGKAEALGTMGEPCDDCPAVKVIKGDKVVTLYAPESVDYIKVTEGE